ncbi:TssN family type VI secretion system protein [Pedobacter sp. MW01-1-1]|uniref:TssN family type VI secretion system protein n=1 Tax=Pedobacter sp. MW01-1-1 TaxID=3383027 RepID=UPI003FEEB909
MLVKTIFLQYLLLPLIVLIASFFLVFIQKKNELVSNMLLIVFVLVTALILCIPSTLGLTGSEFVPIYYLIAQFLYFIAGIGFVKWYPVFFHDRVKNYKALFQILVVTVSMLLGMYLFAVLFNLLSEIGNGYIAATSMLSFCIPLLFYWTYIAFIDIPYEIYDVWTYQTSAAEINFDALDHTKLMVIELEFSRAINDKDRTKVKAKAPSDAPFGTWFKKFIDDYNAKFPNQNIHFEDNQKQPFGWIFYYKKSFFHRRRLMNPKLNILQNNIKEHVTIITKRVIHHHIENL